MVSPIGARMALLVAIVALSLVSSIRDVFEMDTILAASQITMQTFIALYDYDAKSLDELSFHEGDFIYITSKNDSGWWFGTKQGSSRGGYVPSNFLQAAPTLPTFVKSRRLQATSDPTTGTWACQQSIPLSNSMATAWKTLGDLYRWLNEDGYKSRGKTATMLNDDPGLASEVAPRGFCMMASQKGGQPKQYYVLFRSDKEAEAKEAVAKAQFYDFAGADARLPQASSIYGEAENSESNSWIGGEQSLFLCSDADKDAYEGLRLFTFRDKREFSGTTAAARSFNQQPSQIADGYCAVWSEKDGEWLVIYRANRKQEAKKQVEEAQDKAKTVMFERRLRDLDQLRKKNARAKEKSPMQRFPGDLVDAFFQDGYHKAGILSVVPDGWGNNEFHVVFTDGPGKGLTKNVSPHDVRDTEDPAEAAQAPRPLPPSSEPANAWVYQRDKSSAQPSYFNTVTQERLLQPPIGVPPKWIAKYPKAAKINKAWHARLWHDVSVGGRRTMRTVYHNTVTGEETDDKPQGVKVKD